MRRIVFGAAIALLATGCVIRPAPAETPLQDGPALAAWFDCVRARGGVVISAHRALSTNDQPENSIQAIEATGQTIPGAMVELDVTFTSDARIVLMHDQTVERTTTGIGRVAELSLADLRATRLKASNGLVIDAPPPTLAEALEAAGRVRAIAAIDFKPAESGGLLPLARAVINEIRGAGAADRVVLISYSSDIAQTLAGLAPDMMISAVVNDIGQLEGLNPAQVLAWTSSPNEDHWRALAARGVEAQFGTLGAPGQRLDDRYAEDGDVSEYRALHAAGAVVIATDTPIAVSSVLGAEIARTQNCGR
jgi:glycerophosphoryl diester phosphodiesterase